MREVFYRRGRVARRQVIVQAKLESLGSTAAGRALHIIESGDRKVVDNNGAAPLQDRYGLVE